MEFTIKNPTRGLLVFIMALTTGNLLGQTGGKLIYRQSDFDNKIDSLRSASRNLVLPTGDQLEMATYLAVSHYPELAGHKIKIKYKKNVQYPITASWSFWNIFKLRKHHTYVLLLSQDAFVKRLDLNGKIGVIGHEMAHFAYYRKLSSLGMGWWGIKYSISKKFRFQFEKDADRATIDHGLGWQLLDISFYMNKAEVKAYMEQRGYLESVSDR